MKEEEENNELTQEKRDLPSYQRDKISDDKVAKLSADLFKYGRTRWKMGVFPFRMVCMVAQTLTVDAESKMVDLYNAEYTFCLEKVYHYLGLEKTGQRLDILIRTMEEVISSVVQFKSFGPRGGVRWRGINLISYCEIDEEQNRIAIQPNSRAIEYLANMKRWCALQPKNYIRLSTEYQNWFYMFLRKEAGLQPYIIVEIDTIKEMLCLTKVKSYNPKESKNANENFFRYVLGITKPEGWKYNKAGGNTPWNYTTDKDTKKITGTLGVISEKTDIEVKAFPIKEGRTYTKVWISIKLKTATLSRSEKDMLRENIANTMQEGEAAPKKRGRRPKGQPKTIKEALQGSFSQVPIVDSHPNPMADEPAIPPGKIVIPAGTVRILAASNGISEEEFYETMKDRYTRLPNGDYERR